MAISVCMKTEANLIIKDYFPLVLLVITWRLQSYFFLFNRNALLCFILHAYKESMRKEKLLREFNT